MADAKAGQDEVLGSFLLKFINIDSRLEINVVSTHNLFIQFMYKCISTYMYDI